MNRRFGWAMLVAAGLVLAGALSSYERTDAAPPAARDAAADEQAADIALQLAEIKAQVKEINAFLRSGTLRVVVAINPDAPP